MPEPPVPLRKTIPLRLRKILKKSFGSFIKAFFIGGILTVAIFYFLDSLDPTDSPATERMIYFCGRLLGVWLFIFFCFMFWKMIYEYIYYRMYYYDMDDLNVIIRKGVISKHEVTLPFSRITDVYVDQDVVDVFLGLFDVHISTPTVKSGEVAHIDGVNRVGAAELRRLILTQVNKKAA